MSASTWHEAQAPVPFPESLASYRKPRPAATADGIEVVPAEISLNTAGFPDVLISEIVFEIRLRQPQYFYEYR